MRHAELRWPSYAMLGPICAGLPTLRVPFPKLAIQMGGDLGLDIQSGHSLSHPVAQCDLIANLL